MNNKQYLSEEHIVAYLDGELSLAGKEVRSALSKDRQMARAALDYHGLSKAFTVSAHDPRFQLTAETDRKTVKALREALRRGEARMPDAPAVRPVRTSIPLVKQLWFKRSSIGLAFALLLGALFFSLSRNDIKVEPTVAEKTPAVSAPLASQEQPNIPQNSASTENAPSVKPAVTSDRRQVTTPVLRTPATAQTQVTTQETVPSSPNVAQAASTAATNPQDIMISRRYAKMIKETRVVEVTQQDKM